MTIIHCLGSGLVGSFVIKKLLEENLEVNLVDIEKKENISDNNLLTIHITNLHNNCKTN